jgi:hypothetical protein
LSGATTTREKGERERERDGGAEGKKKEREKNKPVFTSSRSSGHTFIKGELGLRRESRDTRVREVTQPPCSPPLDR